MMAPIPNEALIRSGSEGDGLQAVRKCRTINAALAAEGLRTYLFRISLRANAHQAPQIAV